MVVAVGTLAIFKIQSTDRRRATMASVSSLGPLSSSRGIFATHLSPAKQNASFETIFDAIFDQNLGVIVSGKMSVATRRLRERRRREIAKTNRWIGLRDLFME